MSSSDIAISPVEAQKLLKNANVTDPGVIIPRKLEQIMREIKSYITVEAQQNGFTIKARCVNGSPEYIWAHTTAPGIIWLWAQQEDENTRDQWLSHSQESWADFDFKEPSPAAPMRSPAVSPTPSASAAYPQPGPFSFEAVSVPTTPQASSSPTSSGGYRKRRTRKTRRKSNRRGKSRSRSRSHQIRRKKTHHRRHRR